jgi:hypothetical protein
METMSFVSDPLIDTFHTLCTQSNNIEETLLAQLKGIEREWFIRHMELQPDDLKYN